VAAELEHARDALADIDARRVDGSPVRFRSVAKRLTELPGTEEVTRLFQVDSVVPSEGASLGENVVAEIIRGVRMLHRITPAPADDALAAFRQAFRARFGDTPITREIPLAEALDDETGVSFATTGETVEASSLLEGLELTSANERRVAWG